jgi:hypothetical protein
MTPPGRPRPAPGLAHLVVALPSPLGGDVRAVPPLAAGGARWAGKLSESNKVRAWEREARSTRAQPALPSADASTASTAWRPRLSASKGQSLRQQVAANSLSFLSLPFLLSCASIGLGSAQASHSASVIRPPSASPWRQGKRRRPTFPTATRQGGGRRLRDRPSPEGIWPCRNERRALQDDSAPPCVPGARRGAVSPAGAPASSRLGTSPYRAWLATPPLDGSRVPTPSG